MLCVCGFDGRMKEKMINILFVHSLGNSYLNFLFRILELRT